MIILKDISKQFGSKKVLDNISFHISPGESVGIIGLNGAGKTTLLNIISGILKPDSGFIRVNGMENMLKEYKMLRNIAYVSGTKFQLWKDLTIKASLENCIQMYQIDKEKAGKRLENLDEVFFIKKLLFSQPENLSLGERMRCELVYALLAETKVLMLDEAMIGLDVSIKHKIMEYFKAYKQEKKSTMLFTSHNLLEVEELCDRVILLDKGKIIFDGTIERLMQEFAPPFRMDMKLEGNLPDFEDLPFEKMVVEKDSLQIIYDKQKIETANIMKHVLAKCKINDVRIYEPDLEGTIQRIYGKQEQL